jgi:hypothetical protein
MNHAGHAVGSVPHRSRIGVKGIASDAHINKKGKRLDSGADA